MHMQARYREKLDVAGLTSDPYNSKNFVTANFGLKLSTLISTTISLTAQVSKQRSK